MSNLDDLKSFWGEDSTVVKNATRINSLPKYELPTEAVDDDGNNIFDDIKKYIVKTNQNVMRDDGFVVLDDVWLNSKDEYIVERRDFVVDDEGNTLVDWYPQPFCKRRVYMIKISLDEEQKITDNGVKIRKVIKSFKKLERKDGSEYFKFAGRVCVFHNKELGWNPRADNITKQPNEKGEIVEVEDKDPYQHLYVTFFVEKELMMNKLIPYINQKIESYSTAKEILCFGITGYVKRGDLRDPTNPPQNPKESDYWHSINLDDVIKI